MLKFWLAVLVALTFEAVEARPHLPGHHFLHPHPHPRLRAIAPKGPIARRHHLMQARFWRPLAFRYWKNHT